jgi:hypothetical protein
LAHWEANWTGEKWQLSKDDSPIDENLIPFNQGSYLERTAHTCNTYTSWKFYDEWVYWEDAWNEFREGFDCDQWCAEYADWLTTVESNEKEWPLIFAAFQEKDWR